MAQKSIFEQLKERRQQTLTDPACQHVISGERIVTETLSHVANSGMEIVNPEKSVRFSGQPGNEIPGNPVNPDNVESEPMSFSAKTEEKNPNLNLNPSVSMSNLAGLTPKTGVSLPGCPDFEPKFAGLLAEEGQFDMAFCKFEEAIKNTFPLGGANRVAVLNRGIVYLDKALSLPGQEEGTLDNLKAARHKALKELTLVQFNGHETVASSEKEALQSAPKKGRLSIPALEAKRSRMRELAASFVKGEAFFDENFPQGEPKFDAKRRALYLEAVNQFLEIQKEMTAIGGEICGSLSGYSCFWDFPQAEEEAIVSTDVPF